ncbi:MAG: outer membrane protein [Thermodesulfobacteriota bacterium]
MKKKAYVLGVAVLLAALLGMAGAAQSAMWVGAELGGNFPANTTIEAGGFSTGSTPINPAVIGGATIGYDFINSGFGGYAWPDWMKYFSFAVDVTYNKMDIYAGSQGIQRFLPPGRRMDGAATVLTFLFMAHYGFMPDSEVPHGRIHPYIGVGPGIAFTSIDAGAFGIGSGSQTNIALVVEPGIRWFAFKNVSIDTAYRYRRLTPSYDVAGITIEAPLNLHSFLVRANYHF